MQTLKFKVSSGLLECHVCHLRPRGRTHGAGHSVNMCRAGHLFCEGGNCARGHAATCDASTVRCGRALVDIVPRVEVKCACGGYFRNGKMNEHRRDCPAVKISSSTSARRRSKCRVDMDLLSCSSCSGTVRPPVFMSRSGLLICSYCYRANPEGKNSCPGLDYFLGDMIVKVPLTFFSSPKKCDNYEGSDRLPLLWRFLAVAATDRPAAVTGCCSRGLQLQQKQLQPIGAESNKPPADGDRAQVRPHIPVAPAGYPRPPPAGIIGKTKGKAPKDDVKGLVTSDEELSSSEEELSEDSEEELSGGIHLIGKIVADNSSKRKIVADTAVASSCNKKAKI